MGNCIKGLRITDLDYGNMLRRHPGWGIAWTYISEFVWVCVPLRTLCVHYPQ